MIPIPSHATGPRPAAELTITALAGVRMVSPGDNLTDIILEGVAKSGLALQSSDVLIIAQKIVSKAQGRIVDLRTVTPSPRAVQFAEETEKDARLVELILRESTEVVRHRKGVLVVAHHDGYVLANAGIDASNVAGDDHHVLLLPKDCDHCCQDIRAQLMTRTGMSVAVMIIDSLGRAWRNGTVGTALGSAGLPALLDLRGKPDLFGRALRTTEVGLGDEIAAAASLLMGQSNEGTPIVLVRGLGLHGGEGSARDLIRPREIDLFR